MSHAQDDANGVASTPASSSSKVTRRSFLGRSAGVALAIGSTSSFVAACGGGSSGGQVRVLGFASYVDPTIRKLWAEAYPDITLQAIPAGDDNEILTKLRAGGSSAYDVVFTDFGYTPIYQREGLAEVLDLSTMAAGKELFPQFRTAVKAFPNLVEADKSIGLPCQWAPTALLYNTTVAKQPSPPSSWRALWESGFPSGKIGLGGLSPEGYLATAALAKGFPRERVYALSEDELKTIVAYVRELKPFRIYTSDAAQRSALRKGDAWATVAPTPGMAGKINDEAGKDIARAVVPSEGSIGFVDGALLVNKARNRDNAMTFINWFGTDPKVREYVFETYRAAPCSQTAVERLTAKGGETAALVQELKGTNPDVATRVVQAQPPADPKRYAAAWDAVLA